jgi:O-antigen/teichoic acid export membrane protein
MTMLFGRNFEGTGALLQIMLAATPFILLTSIHINHAIAVRATRIYLGVYGGCAVLALVLDVAAVRAFGAVGLAMAVLVRELAMAVVLVSASWLGMNRVLENPPEIS